MANYTKLFSTISEEFGVEVALSVVQICSVNSLCFNIGYKEYFKNPGETLRIQARKILFEKSNEDFQLAYNLFQCAYNWEVQQSLGGIGGCEPETFKQLLEKTTNEVYTNKKEQ